MSDNNELPAVSRRPRFSVFGQPQPGGASREQVMGVDKLERGLSFFAALIALISAAFIFPNYISGKTTYLIQQVKPNAQEICAKGYTLLHSGKINECQKHVAQTHSYWTFLFFASAVMGLLILFAAWRRSRPLLIVLSLLLGAASGTAGFLFLGLGAWLLIRAFRLNRYGTSSMKEANKIARERVRTRTPRAKRGVEAESAKPTPEPSKRYTPKKRPRR